MFQLITPRYQRKSFFRPRRPVNVWGTMLRYQLPELVAFSGAIALVWLGANVDNLTNPRVTPQRAGVQSASVELKVDVPAAYRPSSRRPL